MLVVDLAKMNGGAAVRCYCWKIALAVTGLIVLHGDTDSSIRMMLCSTVRLFKIVSETPRPAKTHPRLLFQLIEYD
jgi:hypothetical protein